MPFPVPANEASRLEALRELAILDTPPEQIYDDGAKLASVLCGTPMAVINFVDADRQWGKALVGMESSEASRDASFCARTIVQEDGVLVVPDVRADPDFANNPHAAEAFSDMRFYAGAAIVTREGHALGSVCAVDVQRARSTPTRSRGCACWPGRPPRTSSCDACRAAWPRPTSSSRGWRWRTGSPDCPPHAAARPPGHRAGAPAPTWRSCSATSTGSRRSTTASATRPATRCCAPSPIAWSPPPARATPWRGWAGDEFVVVCPDLASPTDVRVIEQRLADAVMAPFTVDGRDATPVVSVGTVLARDDDELSVLRRADEAMYLAKRERASTRAARGPARSRP